jgi:hypothetical protein
LELATFVPSAPKPPPPITGLDKSEQKPAPWKAVPPIVRAGGGVCRVLCGAP